MGKDREKEKTDILQEYKEALAVSDDESTFVSSFYAVTKITAEMSSVMDLFNDGDVKPYEALVRFDALLELIAQARVKVKEKL